MKNERVRKKSKNWEFGKSRKGFERKTRIDASHQVMGEPINLQELTRGGRLLENGREPEKPGGRFEVNTPTKNPLKH